MIDRNQAIQDPNPHPNQAIQDPNPNPNPHPHQAIQDVHNATPEMMKNPKIHMTLMKRLFAVFDVDHGGEIDGKEMRALMIQVRGRGRGRGRG